MFAAVTAILEQQEKGHDEHHRPGRRARMMALVAFGAFVLVPNSEAVHAVIRATLGVGGVQCC